MKIGMQTWGSHGDVRPFLALAEGLQAAGHDVTLLITCLDGAAYEGTSFSPHGVTLRLLAPPAISPDEAEKIGRAAYNTRNPLTQMAEILRLCFAPAEEAMFAAARELCADADLLIGHYFMHPLQIAGRAGRPALCQRAAVACGDPERVQPFRSACPWAAWQPRLVVADQDAAASGRGPLSQQACANAWACVPRKIS